MPLLLIIVGVFLMVHFANKKRHCLNERLGARPRPLFGSLFGTLTLLGLILFGLCLFIPAVSYQPATRSHSPSGATEAAIDMQEEVWPWSLWAQQQAKARATAEAKARAAAESERVKQMIANADTAKEEPTPEHNEPAGVSETSAQTTAAEAPVVLEAESTAPPAPRPKWVDEPAGLVGGVYYRNVVAGPHATRAGCEEAMRGELQTAVEQFIESHLGAGASQLVQLPPSYIRNEIVKDYYEETYNASFGPMKNLHAHLAFDGRVRANMERMYHAARAQSRMKEVALGAGGVLVLLGVLFSYLKLDTMTRGYYTGRLRLALALILLGGGAAAFRLVQHL
jgi:hypothetical protein